MEEIMKQVIYAFCIFLMFATSYALCQEVDKAAIADAEVSRFIEHWGKNLPPKWRKMALKHKASVVEWSLYYDLDPLLVCRIISRESSWRDWVIGDRGEIGLMQINNDAIKMRYKTEVLKTNPEQNIKAGCELLRFCIDNCPTLKSAIGKYGSGHCTEKGMWLERRYEQYLKDIERFRK